MTKHRGIADTVMMVRPHYFAYNENTADSNVFQKIPQDLSGEEVHKRAAEEFNRFAEMLSRHGVRVVLYEDSPEPVTPDAIFPNNWMSTHDDGSIVLYPMESRIRRNERRSDIVESLQKEFSFQRVIDLAGFEAEDRFLEGTGSMVFDRANSTVYACISSRTDELVLADLARMLSISETVSFTGEIERDGSPCQIYHTNVMMAVGESTAVICPAAVRDDSDRTKLVSSLVDKGRKVIEISIEQMYRFAGNMLQLRNASGDLLWVLSSQAYEALTTSQRDALKADGSRLCHSPIETIETAGGGSARCMLAEIFPPSRKSQTA